MTATIRAKPYGITKREVYQAWLHVKEKGGAGGVDSETLATFEAKLSRNLYKLWNRMSSGTYFPQAVKRVEIPKKDGSNRPLGIPTIYDRVAQEVVRKRLEAVVEPLFHEDSYGYRAGKSAHDAIGVCRRRSWEYDWVLDVDIRKFFDTIDHGLLLKAVEKHSPERWMVLYIERWLKAPVQHQDGKKEENKCGTPQGGVISPLLANLYLHYAFDKWMGREFPHTKFERYADDLVIHCESQDESERVKEALKNRLAECGLQLHPEKTKSVYCKDSSRTANYDRISFTFLGYTFRPRAAQNRKTKQYFTSFLPAASKEGQKSFRCKLRAFQIRRCVTLTVEELAEQFNPLLRGWFGYFSRFYPSALRWVQYSVDRQLTRWARNKYRWAYRRSVRWITRLKQQQPNLFAHWQLNTLHSG